MSRILTLVAFLCVAASDAIAAEHKPNILFIFADDQRADTIAALGNPIIKTPNLDRLARGGRLVHNRIDWRFSSNSKQKPPRFPGAAWSF